MHGISGILPKYESEGVPSTSTALNPPFFIRKKITFFADKGLTGRDHSDRVGGDREITFRKVKNDESRIRRKGKSARLVL